MAQKRLGQHQTGNPVAFPPEANGEFDVVADARLAEWREKLKDRFGIGAGKLTAIEDPAS